MRVVSVVGARPQFVKLAPVADALARREVDHLVVHTGQHYDRNMSDDFFADLQIPTPHVSLGIGSGSHGEQTGAMLVAIERALAAEKVDIVLVYGDTNSTLAGALAAAKMGIRVAHLEAGLRSFNRGMPEELNRVVADHISDLLLAPTVAAARQLAHEGLADRTHVTGDVMADVCLRMLAATTSAGDLPEGVSPGEYVIATVHRPSNTDHRERLRSVIDYLAAIPAEVLLAVHPRLRAKADAFRIELSKGNVHAVSPWGYPEMVAKLKYARAVVTDSGGLQKEAYLAGVPCATLRAETEWVETLEGGWNILVQGLTNPERDVLRAVDDASARGDYFGTGDAAMRVAEALLSESD